jgi:predicted nicotinamide N-methyase
VAELITGCWRTQAIRAAVDLGVVESLGRDVRSADALAAACGCTTDALRRLLRALCALGLCTERADGAFGLSADGLFLLASPPDGRASLAPMATWWGGPLWTTWGDLGDTVRTGASARARRTGHAGWRFLEGAPDDARAFHASMAALTAVVARSVARMPIWRRAKRIVDVGGGGGELAVEIAAAHTQCRVTILDRPHAETAARVTIEARGLADRVVFTPGDFLEHVPAGADHLLLKSILHNWDDAACRRILACCAKAAAPGAVLVLVERIRPDRLRPGRRDEGLARTDLNMLIGPGGRERSLAELSDLLASVGFVLRPARRTIGEFAVLRARRRGG